ncbi:MAG: UDP-N-acetylmuramoyl-L-alanyl-D-glutamate--2,6-diaminopimelate ligase [Acidimicrobiia bacterium]
MLLSELLDDVLLGGAEILAHRAMREVEITSITHDSRQRAAGSLFACLRGTSHDGHDHAGEAIAGGAVALLVERFCPFPVPQLQVADTRAALGSVSSACYGHPSRSLDILGVTGTNGKTTVTYLLEKILAAAGGRPGVIGTVESRLGGRVVPALHTTPEAPDLQALLARMRDEGMTGVAMEVSSHALAQHRVDGTRFAAVCFTNLSLDHLDYHGTLDAYFEVKASLFTPSYSGVAACNLDDPRGAELLRRARLEGMTVAGFAGPSGSALPTGEAPQDLEATVRGVGLESGPAGNRFRILASPPAVPTPQVIPVSSPLLGAHNASNALAAATTALMVGVPAEAVAMGLGAPIVVPGRMERVDVGEGAQVYVDYAHTPEALATVLRSGRELALQENGRVLVVFGCGGDRDPSKRPVMGRLAASLADLAWVTSDNSRYEDPAVIADEILSGMEAATALSRTPPRRELDRQAAIEEAIGEARPGDVVILAGKGHETGQTTGTVTVAFDDREVARQVLVDLGRGAPARQMLGRGAPR